MAERTADLVVKNRELEIETSLERVRTVAMSMNKPDDLLKICKALFKELLALGFTDLRNAIIQTFDDDKKYLNDYDFSDATGGWISRIPYTGNPIIEKFIKNIRKNNDSFVETMVTGKELEDWKAFRKANDEVDDPRLLNIKELFYYHYSVGEGDIGISTFSSISTEKQNLLKRFRNVFDLAYKRYVDITKAEAQAREAQIEAALERVRARTMAMHKTPELQSVIHTVHQELLKLNLGIHGGSFIAINADINKERHCWGAGVTANTSEKVQIPFYNKPFYTNIVKRIKKGPAFFTETYTQKEKKEFFSFLFRQEPWKKLTAKQKKETLSSPGGYTRSCAVSKHTSIFIINHFGEKFSEEENNILKRFGKVFEQTFIRFLDLQKAEAQAREAQIEAALEKVRSSSLAMHRSDDLKHVVAVVLEQFQRLGLELEGGAVHIQTFNEDSKEAIQWSADPLLQIVASYKIPFNDNPVFADFIKAKHAGESFFFHKYSFEEKNKWFEWAFVHTDFKKLPDNFKKILLGCESYAHWAAIQKNSAILVNNILGKSLSEDQIDILKRFSNVFEQSYIRFLDLQKAEAQAREAQIETGLEKVRSRTLAMQKSDELADTSIVIFEQLINLGIEPNRLFIGIIKDETGNIEAWATNEDGTRIGDHFTLSIDRNESVKKMYEGWKHKKTSITIDMQGKELQDYFHYLANEMKIPFKGGLSQKRRVQTIAYFGHGLIGMASPDEQPQATTQLLERFAAVKTYWKRNRIGIEFEL